MTSVVLTSLCVCGDDVISMNDVCRCYLCTGDVCRCYIYIYLYALSLYMRMFVSVSSRTNFAQILENRILP